MLGESELIRSGVLRVAELMAVAAKTAPKARGMDNIRIALISGREELEKLASKMEEMAATHGSFFARDAASVRASDAVLLIGADVIDLGLPTPPVKGMIDLNTYMALVNLGIALGSAVKIASILNVDNRIMYSIGMAAKELGMLKAEYVLGVPLSAKAKNPYFDRKHIHKGK